MIYALPYVVRITNAKRMRWARLVAVIGMEVGCSILAENLKRRDHLRHI
jgi:hypothetical protein